MRTSLAWFDLLHHRIRTASALAGVMMAILLIFLQYGFYQAAVRSSILVLEQFSYDLVLVSSQYVFLGAAGEIQRHRLVQARAVEGIRRVAPLYYGRASWRNPSTGALRELLVLGIDPDSRPFRHAEVNELLLETRAADAALVDRKTGLGYESFDRGTITEVDGRRLRVAGAYQHGVGFAANAGLVVSDATYRRVFPSATLERATLGLLWLDAAAEPDRMKARLESILAADVRVLTRAEHLAADTEFVMTEKPIGVIFTTGVWLAFVVGALILYQILSAEVLNHLREYATLKAMGFGTARIYLIVWQKAALFALAGFMPALLLAWGVYWVIDTLTTLPTRMSAPTGLAVFAASGLMCLISGSLAARKVDRADPAELF